MVNIAPVEFLILFSATVYTAQREVNREGTGEGGERERGEWKQTSFVVKCGILEKG